MKDFLFLLFLGLALSAVLYFCYIFVIQKSIATVPEQPEINEIAPPTDAPPIAEDPNLISKKQSETAEKIWDRQKRMMEDQRQRMRDIQKR